MDQVTQKVTSNKRVPGVSFNGAPYYFYRSNAYAFLWIAGLMAVCVAVAICLEFSMIRVSSVAWIWTFGAVSMLIPSLINFFIVLRNTRRLFLRLKEHGCCLCLRCSYPIENLDGETCVECGTPFERDTVKAVWLAWFKRFCPPYYQGLQRSLRYAGRRKPDGIESPDCEGQN